MIGHHFCVGLPVSGFHSLESSLPGDGLVQIQANTNPVYSQHRIQDPDLRSNMKQGSAATITVPLLNRLFVYYSCCEETHHPVFVKQFQILQWKNRVYGVCASINLTILGFSMVGTYVFAGSTITDNINYRAFVKLEPNGAAKATHAERHIVDKLDLTSSFRRVLPPNQFQTDPLFSG